MIKKAAKIKARPKFKPRPKLNHRRFNFKIIKLVLIVFLSSALLVFGLVLSGRIFSVQKVNLKVYDLTCADQIQIAKTLSLERQNILFLNIEAKKTELRTKYQCISRIDIHKKLPNQINIDVWGRKPALQISLIPDQTYQDQLILEKKPVEGTASAIEASMSSRLIKSLDFEVHQSSVSGQIIVDETGYIFAQTVDNYSGFKIAASANNPKVGQHINPGVVKAVLALLPRLKELGIEVFSAKVVSSKNFLLLVTLPPELSANAQKDRLAFNLEKDVLNQIAALQLILQKSKMDLKLIESVDLRFDKPVVVYSPKKKR